MESVECSKSANDMTLDGYLMRIRARKTIGSNESNKCKLGTELCFVPWLKASILNIRIIGKGGL
jgi:hypothetical protein